ncbi:Major facilitator superfamily domain, general substrate transporter [Plasmopara halstedii]|uniref:Major facilitator superfamily domain, general substrate transporter n=1 Tax=Plasmopara halstedii TaxID=4781 RepID=A0A0P1B1R7_PLAHL|nr:Major facilitator superfamily domain, general substrate transporter [Plasmopara halstedii]CEG48146.1 Major facilitator superfamily domain, general substrate transporter [Plasmopara halstedii]|eukprot:XP_024584515.1 Major facilitator superfamily domain, general substrate transporter [Plasmopara halstedii]
MDRLSAISSINRIPDDLTYGSHITPTKIQRSDMENGALREGKPLALLSFECIGLLAQYAGVGFLTGIIPGVIYPVLQGYLNAEGTTVVSASVLVQVPWCYKMFFGVISDCFPILGYRRRPYMILGWLFCITILLIMAAMNVPAPYYGDSTMREIAQEDWTDDQIQSLNLEAPNSAGKYVIPMMLASFGYLLCEVAADAMVVEYAQREPIEQRGRLQTAVYTVKTSFTAVGAAVIAFFMNGDEYAGSFTFALSFQDLMLITGIICTPLLLVSWVFLHEERVINKVSFTEYNLAFWKMLQKRAIYQIVAYKFFSGVFNSFNIVSASNIKMYWVHATPFNNSVMTIVGTIFYATTLALTGKYGLDWNWRTIIIITMCGALLIDAFMTMFTVWDIVRNQWFWLGVPMIEYLPDGIRFIIATYVVVELAEPGLEGALYGLLTATTNLTTPFGRSMAKLVNAQFHVWLNDIQADTTVVRRDVTITIWICYCMKLLSLAFLPLLPRQKAETQELKRTGGSSRMMGFITVGYLAFAIIWATLVNVLSMYTSTMCWKITGGCAPKS